MERVLLAIDGLYPGTRIFKYSVQFCQRMRTELVVLQIINPQNSREMLKTLYQKIGSFQRFFEETIEAATLAEAGGGHLARKCFEEGHKHIRAMLPVSQQAGVVTHVFQRLGKPDREIYKYVQRNTDIVLAVYDTNGLKNKIQTKRRQNLLKKNISYTLGVPLVIFQGSKEHEHGFNSL